VSKYYCHACANKYGLIPDPPAGKVVRTLYQYRKHQKHTSPDPTYPIQSVFSDSSTSVYAGYIVNALHNGAVEVDDDGRRDIIWCAGRYTGFRYELGILVQPNDAVKIVLSSDTGLVHAFPENSTNFNTRFCEYCGKTVVC
jgi:hypothetical protein